MSRVNLKQSFPPSSNYPFNSTTARDTRQSRAWFLQSPIYSVRYPAQYADNKDKYHVHRQKPTVLLKQFEWIVAEDRAKGLIKTQNNKVMGPGAYGVPQYNSIPKKSGWGKSVRFNRKINNRQLPGPGSYDYLLPRQNAPAASSAFKSKIPKSIFEQANNSSSPMSRINAEQFEQFQTDKEQQIKQISTPVSKKRVESSFVFSSKVPRFMQDVRQNVGPGSYNLQKERYRIKTQCPKIVVNAQKLIANRKKTLTQVGPGSYNMAKYQMGRLIEFKGYAVTRQTRFNFRHTKKNQQALLPGPGQYMKNKYMFIRESEVLGSSRPKPIKSTSLIEMKRNRSLKKDNALMKSGSGQAYNLNMFDIQFRLRQKLQHNQRLRIMQVSMPAFNSKAPRLK